MTSHLLLLLGSSVLFPLAQQFASPPEVLAGLHVEHPRLILSAERVAELQELRETDELLEKSIADVIRQADELRTAALLQHRLVGPRLLQVSRACLDRVYTLGLAWRLTGEPEYARAVEANLLTVCAFPDWNPSHFLDTAEMSHAVGVGYDWCFEALEPAAREKIRAGLIRNGLEPGVRAYTAERPAWWSTSAFNWNQVCNSGLTIGALAIAETDPRFAETIVAHAVRSLPKALETYEPDGAWGEGPGYWGYATNYTVYGLAAMVSALGHDFGLSDRTGLARAGFFPISACGPTGLYVAYADVGERAKRKGLPALFWLARRYGEPVLAAAERAWLARNRGDARHVIWYVPPAGEEPFEPALDQRFRGPVELALLRSSVSDPQAIFVALKAGYNAVNHGHLDLGNFELDALGVRWARDLGADDYNLPGYWDGKQGGRRWSYYRLGSHSHNVLTLDDEQQAVAGKATIVEFASEADAAHAIVAIEQAWPGRAKSYRRGIRLPAGREQIQVQDELELTRACEVAWGMTTDAELELDGARAVLAHDGMSLRATILSPAGVVFSVESAEREAPERTNRGVRRLVIRFPAEAGSLRVTVALQPMPGGEPPETTEPSVVPLADW